MFICSTVITIVIPRMIIYSVPLLCCRGIMIIGILNNIVVIFLVFFWILHPSSISPGCTTLVSHHYNRSLSHAVHINVNGNNNVMYICIYISLLSIITFIMAVVLKICMIIVIHTYIYIYHYH